MTILDSARRTFMKAAQARSTDSQATQVLKPSDVPRLVPNSELSDLKKSVPRSLVITDIGQGKKGPVALLERQYKGGAGAESGGASYMISADVVRASLADLRAAGGFDPLIEKLNGFYTDIYGPKPADQTHGVGKPGRGALKAQARIADASDAVPSATAHATRTDFRAGI